jgi:hypothetical protein
MNKVSSFSLSDILGNWWQKHCVSNKPQVDMNYYNINPKNRLHQFIIRGSKGNIFQRILSGTISLVLQCSINLRNIYLDRISSWGKVKLMGGPGFVYYYKDIGDTLWVDPSDSSNTIEKKTMYKITPKDTPLICEVKSSILNFFDPERNIFKVKRPKEWADGRVYFNSKSERWGNHWPDLQADGTFKFHPRTFLKLPQNQIIMFDKESLSFSLFGYRSEFPLLDEDEIRQRQEWKASEELIDSCIDKYYQINLTKNLGDTINLLDNMLQHGDNIIKHGGYNYNHHMYKPDVTENQINTISYTYFSRLHGFIKKEFKYVNPDMVSVTMEQNVYLWLRSSLGKSLNNIVTNLHDRGDIFQEDEESIVCYDTKVRYWDNLLEKTASIEEKYGPELKRTFKLYFHNMNRKESVSKDNINQEIDKMVLAWKYAIFFLAKNNLSDVERYRDLKYTTYSTLQSLNKEIRFKDSFSLDMMDINKTSLHPKFLLGYPKYVDENSIRNKLNKLDEFGIKTQGEWANMDVD